MLRNLTNLYIIYDESMLMLYRIGSRAMSEPLWVGIGGHMEKDEKGY